MSAELMFIGCFEFYITNWSYSYLTCSSEYSPVRQIFQNGSLFISNRINKFASDDLHLSMSTGNTRFCL